MSIERMKKMTTVERIQQKLDEKGIKPAKMSKDLGFSNGLFSQWKSGLQKPSAEKIEKIAEYLNCSVDYLMGKEKSIYYELSEDKQRLLEMYDLLTEREQGEILGELKVLTRGKLITVATAARNGGEPAIETITQEQYEALKKAKPRTY